MQEANLIWHLARAVGYRMQCATQLLASRHGPAAPATTHHIEVMQNLGALQENVAVVVHHKH